MTKDASESSRESFLSYQLSLIQSLSSDMKMVISFAELIGLYGQRKKKERTEMNYLAACRQIIRKLDREVELASMTITFN